MCSACASGRRALRAKAATPAARFSPGQLRCLPRPASAAVRTRRVPTRRQAHSTPIRPPSTPGQRVLLQSPGLDGSA
eukprot:scaffold15395_cov147-Isochrysis_galbana.AAC.1